MSKSEVPGRYLKHGQPRRWGTIRATKAGSTFAIRLSHGQNSLGEPNVFADKRPANGRKEFEALRGYPLYAIQTWLVDHGYTYEVCDDVR